MSNKTEVTKADRINRLMNDFGYSFAHFKGGDFMSGPHTNGFIEFDARRFKRLVEDNFEGISNNMINDFAITVKTKAPDLSHTDKYIGFDSGRKVWDMEKLEWAPDQIEYVYSSPIVPNNKTAPVKHFLLELAKGDPELAQDYLQAVAPLFMYRKPTGVLWFVGDGANGKSSLIDAVHRLLGGKYLASLTTAAIEDGKATPALRGILGNIVKEASENRVEDTASYKAIGTHESFGIRQLYTQEMLTIDTNFHTIFNANNVPIFSDKTKGARRRTLVVPFKAHFKDDPTFDERTFTPEFLGGFLTLLLEETHTIAENGYRYKWSDATLMAKEAYDSEVNSVEAFLAHLNEQGVAGFTNYARLKYNYENWCSQTGMVPLGVTTLKRTFSSTVIPIRKSYRYDRRPVNYYFFTDSYDENLTWLDNGYGIRTPEEDEQENTEQAQSKLAEGW